MTDKEKLEKLKKLADAMYYAAQYLTTDASKLHKAMDEYHKFIVNDYHKEEPTIPDIVDEHFDEMIGEESASSYKPDAFEMALTEMIDKARKCVIEPWVVAAQWKDELLSLAKGEESVSKNRFVFKAIPRLLDMIEPNDRAKAYTTKLAEALEKEGYTTDAKIVRESIKIMNGEKVAMATMTEKPVSEDLEEAAKHYLYSNILYDDVYVGNPTDKDCIEMFKAGANWQKQKDAETLNQNALLYDARLKGIEIGKAEMKQQMIKDAVDRLVVCNNLTHGFKDIVMEIPSFLNVGDKVKLIILKEG